MKKRLQKETGNTNKAKVNWMKYLEKRISDNDWGLIGKISLKHYVGEKLDEDDLAFIERHEQIYNEWKSL